MWRWLACRAEATRDGRRRRLPRRRGRRFAAPGTWCAFSPDRGIVEAARCSSEPPVTPATGQERCQIGGDGEVTVMMFADASGVDDRIGSIRALNRLGKSSMMLIRGPNWLVNPDDLDPADWETARSAVGGELISVS
jgi:hypothetical protein